MYPKLRSAAAFGKYFSTFSKVFRVHHTAHGSLWKILVDFYQNRSPWLLRAHAQFLHLRFSISSIDMPDAVQHGDSISASVKQGELRRRFTACGRHGRLSGPPHCPTLSPLEPLRLTPCVSSVDHRPDSTDCCWIGIRCRLTPPKRHWHVRLCARAFLASPWANGSMSVCLGSSAAGGPASESGTSFTAHASAHDPNKPKKICPIRRAHELPKHTENDSGHNRIAL